MATQTRTPAYPTRNPHGFRNPWNSLATSTRPDISYAVGVLACFNKNPGIDHWKAVKHLFRYLKGSCYDFLSFFISPNVSSHYAVSSSVGLIHASSIVSLYVLPFVLHIVSSLFYYRFIHCFDYLYV